MRIQAPTVRPASFDADLRNAGDLVQQSVLFFGQGHGPDGVTTPLPIASDSDRYTAANGATRDARGILGQYTADARVSDDARRLLTAADAKLAAITSFLGTSPSTDVIHPQLTALMADAEQALHYLQAARVAS
jgi:hypothetical protein